MNGLKSIHTDILIIMIDDVNERVRSGDLSDTEYLIQISPLNSELFVRAVALYNDAGARAELYRKQAEMDSRQAANNVRQVYQSFIKYQINMNRIIQEFNDFLAEKKLEKAFDDWQDEQFQKRLEGNIT